MKGLNLVMVNNFKAKLRADKFFITRFRGRSKSEIYEFRFVKVSRDWKVISFLKLRSLSHGEFRIIKSLESCGQQSLRKWKGFRGLPNATRKSEKSHCVPTEFTDQKIWKIYQFFTVILQTISKLNYDSNSYSQLISNRPRRFEILRPKWLDCRCMPLHSFVVNHCCKALHAGYLCRFGQRLCRYLDSFPKEDSSVNVDKKTLIKIVHKYSWYRNEKKKQVFKF